MFKLIKRSKIVTIIVYILELLAILALIYFNKTGKIEITYTISMIAIMVIFDLSIISSIFQFINFDKTFKKYYLKVGNTLGADIKEVYKYGELGLICFDDDKRIIWSSGLFDERNIKLIGDKLLDKFPAFKDLFSGETQSHVDEVITYINKRQYKVVLVEELSLLIFKDVTDFETLVNKNNDDQPIVGTIVLDDISGVVSVVGEEDYTLLVNQIHKTILEWAKEKDILIRKIKEDQYFIVLNEKLYQELLKDDFEILNKVKKLSKKKDVTVTISIGFGRGTNDYTKSSELSYDAINIAQSRGGNQVVVNNYARQLDFYGGSGSENKSSSGNVVRRRIMGESLCSHISNSDRVYIIPHLEADFDAIGACLGVQSLAKSLDKEVFIVCDPKQIEMKARIMLEDLFDTDELLISPSKALSHLTSDTLVVVCDVLKPSLTTSQKMIEQASKIAIIDHHREGEETIDNPTFIMHEVEASSTCEIVAEMISLLNNKIEISSNVATYMLSGILLDTANLVNKTTSTTFKACTTLKELGADTKLASLYMKDEYEEYELKAKILSNLESPFYGVVVGIAPDNIILERAMLAKVALEATNIKGIQSSFVIGLIDDNTIGISARSNGDMNVQIIMESLGGGGHHSSAACQLEGLSIDEAKAKLIDAIKTYNEDL